MSPDPDKTAEKTRNDSTADNAGDVCVIAKDEELKQLLAVMKIANAVASQVDLDDILVTITTEMSKIIDFDIGSVAIYSKNENCLYIRHEYRVHSGKSGVGTYVPFDESNLIGWVAINRKPVLRGNIPADDRFNEIMKEDDLKSDIVVPLIAENKLVGTINYGSFKRDNFSGFDLEIINNFRHFTSIAIEKATLMQELKGLGDKYRMLMDTGEDLIMLIDISGVIVECNNAATTIFGYSKDEVTGRMPSDFAVPSRREAVRVNYGRVLRGEITKAIEVPYLKKNGETVYLDINFNIIKIKDHPYVFVVGHNVTDRKALQERITIQNRELKASNRKLLELDCLKSEFLGRVSHELRTPLSVIMAYSDTLLNDSEESINNDTRTEFLRVIETQSNNLLRLINDLLDLSKVEVSETMLDVTESSINQIITASITVVEEYAAHKDVEIVTCADDSVPIMRFDPLRIKQVCVNLVNNAIKFTPRRKKVVVSTFLGKQDAIVSVSDEGPGIDMKEIADIFDNFTQVDGGVARTANGMGIGLRLVKHYIDLHKGSIWVESEKGNGATFFFSLPLTDNFSMNNCGQPANPTQ